MGLLHNLIKSCRTSKNEVDDKQLPIQQIEFLGKVKDAFRVFPYGMSANVPEDFLGMLFPNGWFMPMSPFERPKNLQSGEVVFFHPVTGSKMLFKNDGDMEITGDVIFKNNVTINGNLTVLGSTSLGSTVTSNGKDISDTHTHIGSPTAPSGGVSPTGAPN